MFVKLLQVFKNPKKRNRILMIALIVIVILSVIIVSFLTLSKHYENVVYSKEVARMQDVSKHNKEVFETKANGAFDMLSMANRLPKGERQGFTSDIIKLLLSIKQTGDFYNVYFLYSEHDNDDTGIYSATLNVEAATLDDSLRSHALVIRDREYYKAALGGEKYISNIINPTNDDNIVNDKEEVIVFSLPIYCENAIIGVVCGGIDVENAYGMLLTSSNTEDNYSLLVNPGGEILVRNREYGVSSGVSNIFDFLGSVNLINSSLSDIESSLAEGKQDGSFTFSFGGGTNYARFVKSNVSNMYIFSFASDKIIKGDVETVEKMMLLFICVACLLFLLIIIYVIMQRNRTGIKLSNVNRRFRTATKMINGCIFEINLLSNKIVYFENTDKIFGVGSGEFIGSIAAKTQLIENKTDTLLKAIFIDEDEVTVEDAFIVLMEKDFVTFEARVNNKTEGSVWCKVHLSLVTDKFSSPVSIIGLLTDINEIKNELLSDPLTGALNKTAIATAVDTILRTNSYKKNALLMLDIDDFKSINDNFGHSFGDAVLIDIVTKLKKLFPDSLIGRVGGDEFVVFMSDIAENKTAVLGANALCKSFKENYGRLRGPKSGYKISCSIGIAFSSGEKKFKNLFPKVDVALYKAKQKGKDCYYIFTNKENIDINKLDGSLLMPTAEDANRRIHIKERIFELLYSSVDFDNSINMILRLIGEFSKASRTYVFENSLENKNFFATYEWCNDEVASKFGKLKGRQQASAYAYTVLFEKSAVFYCPDTNKLKGFWAENLNKRKVRSCLQVAFTENGKLTGLIGIEDCFDKHHWKPDELDTLVYTAKLIGTFISKKRTETVLMKLFKMISTKLPKQQGDSIHNGAKKLPLERNAISTENVNKPTVIKLNNFDDGTVYVDEEEIRNLQKRKNAFESEQKDINEFKGVSFDLEETVMEETESNEVILDEESSIAQESAWKEDGDESFESVELKPENTGLEDSVIRGFAEENSDSKESAEEGSLNTDNDDSAAEEQADELKAESSDDEITQSSYEGKYENAPIIIDDDIVTYSEDSSKFTNRNIMFLEDGE